MHPAGDPRSRRRAIFVHGATRASTGRVGTILLVDDDDDARALMGEALASVGHRAVTAKDGAQALRTLERDPDAVDVVVLDLLLPGTDGRSFLVDKDHKGLSHPVLVVSGALGLVNIPDVAARLKKPIDLRTFLPTIDCLLAARRDERELHRRRRAPRTITELEAGTVLADKYRLDARIDAGACGVIFRARHLDLDTDVAVKVMRCTGRHSDIEAMRREGMAACRVQHPNAVRVHDFGVRDDVAFLVMELLHGDSLYVELSRGALSLPRIAWVLGPVADVLAHAHDARTLHKDIKPANIVLHRGPVGEVVKVVDFGVAAIAAGEDGTCEGPLAGTPQYMAPEIVRGRSHDGRADVFSLGAVLYEALTGQMPFRGKTPQVVMDQVLVHEPPPPSTLRKSTPPALDALVRDALSKDPSLRPDARAFAQRLRAGING